MNEWLKKIFAKAKELWSKWKPIQKVIIIGIIIVVLVAIVAAARMSSKPSEVRLFNAPVSDENNLTEILDRLDTLHIEAHSRDNYIYVNKQIIYNYYLLDLIYIYYHFYLNKIQCYM